MKKIPTLFKREYANHKVVAVHDEITPGCEDAFRHGIATIKIDGSCCAIIKGEKYKRYDAKKGKKPPVGAIPCCDPDPVTGHWPHWVKLDLNNPADKWYVAAMQYQTQDGTYEAIGIHFQGNPYKMDYDNAVPHGIFEAKVERTFEGVKKWLEVNECEGIVFWLNGEPVCKIKRSDFGLPWPAELLGNEQDYLNWFAEECQVGVKPNGSLIHWNRFKPFIPRQCVCCGEIIPEGRQECPLCLVWEGKAKEDYDE